ncbi:MAG: hypothetical protein KGJ78_08105 [Alphaproteobacteria bacterium]|nr:hypothetical protein [Alphaproteobacteria bacterium]
MWGFHYIDMTIFWGAIVLFVLIGNLFSYLTRASRHRMIERLAEKGQTISPELLASLGSSHGDERKNPVSGAIILMFIGIAIAVFFWALGGGGNLFESEHVPNWLPVVGIFPFAIGLGRFIGLMFEKRTPK